MRKIILAITLCLLTIASGPTYSSPHELYSLSFANLQQRNVSLSKFKHKVLLINFWATWCPPCVKEMPAMERLRQHFLDQPFEIIAINAGQPAIAVQSFLSTISPPLSFPILLDTKGRSFTEFGLKGLPMSFIFDQHGKLIARLSGDKAWDSRKSINAIQAIIDQTAKVSAINFE